MGPDPHHALYTPGKYAVDENFERIDGPRTVNASYRRVALNHYPIKSLEEFKIKAIRGAVRLHTPTAQLRSSLFFDTRFMKNGIWEPYI